MTNNTWIWALGILCLGLGLSLGAQFSPFKEVVEIDKPIVTTEVVTEYVNNTIDNTLSDRETHKQAIDSALSTVFDRIGDEDEFLTCDAHEYEEDEVTAGRVYYEDSDVDYDKNDNRKTVTVKARFVFDDGSDERDCKETRTYEVITEDNENPEVEIVE